MATAEGAGGLQAGAAGASDRLVLSGPGASASGHTALEITNLGGLGGLTAGDGIEVVTALDGATTTAQTTRDAFSLAGGHVDAGAYEYRLHAADAGGAGENWYLRSTTAVVPPGVEPPVGPPGSPTVGPLWPIPVPTYRLEAPLHAALPAQLREGNFAMLGNLRQRMGDDAPAAAAGSGDTPAPLGARRAWGRLVGSDLDIRQGGSVQPASDGRVAGLQAGTDVWATATWRAGLYVGQLEGDAEVRGFARGLHDLPAGRTDLRSQYLGAYGTYLGESGWYADVVLQAGRHRYSARPLLGLPASGKGSSVLASVEAGRAFDLGGGWSLEPSVQLAHQRLSLDDSQIPNARVRHDAHDGWLARAGLRVRGSMTTGAGVLQPYGRVNVYHGSGGNDVARFIGPGGSTDLASGAGHTSTELAGGFSLALGPRTSVYAEAGKRWASGGGAKVRSALQGSAGLRVRW